MGNGRSCLAGDFDEEWKRLSKEFQHDEKGLRRLADAADMQAILKLVTPSIYKLRDFMSQGHTLAPEAAKRTRGSLRSLLMTIQAICGYRRVDFREVMAHLHPANDLLLALSLAAEKEAGQV